MTRAALRLLAVTAVACGLLASPAYGASVRATTGGSGAYGVSEGSVVYEAAAGEVNKLHVSLVPGSHGVADIRDDGAPISAGDRCTAVSQHEVRCDAAADSVNVFVNVNDLDDRVTIDVPLYGWVLGGDGDDTLIGGCQLTGGAGNDVLQGCIGINPGLNHTLLGGPGDDVIDGGDAPDIIDGGSGHDTLRGGDGNDTFNDGDGKAGVLDADVIDGGAGSDWVWYSDRHAAVRVDLTDPSASQGAVGENDTLRNVENVLGGTGNDTLSGDDGPNRLDGGDGDDTIVGRGGDDMLLDGAGIDTLDAGPGDDRLVTRDLYADHVSCGAGHDGVLADRGDLPARGCEGVTLTPVDLIPGRYRLGVKNGSFDLRLACPDMDELPTTVAREFETCAFDVVLKLPVRGRLVVAARATCTNIACGPVTLRTKAWQELKRRRQLTGSIEFVRRPRAGALRHVERVVVKVSRR